MITIADLRVYKTGYDRRGIHGKVWAVAAPNGVVMVYTNQYPSLELLQDAVFALNAADEPLLSIGAL